MTNSDKQAFQNNTPPAPKLRVKVGWILLSCLFVLLFPLAVLLSLFAFNIFAALTVGLMALAMLVFTVVVFRTYLQVSESFIRSRIVFTRTIAFKDINKLKMDDDSLKISSSTNTNIVIYSSYQSSTVAVEYIIRRLKSMNRLEEIELCGDTAKIKKIAESKLKLRFKKSFAGSAAGEILLGLLEGLGNN